jgi:hypothetical protein
MPLGPEQIAVTVPIGAITATTEYSGWTNPYSDANDVYEVEAANVNLLDAITGTGVNWWSFRLEHVTTAGVHTTVIGTKTYNTSVDHVAYVGDNMTLASTGLQIAPGEGFNVNVVLEGAGNPYGTMSADAKVNVLLVKGETSAA